jgi:hypothetical protein
MMAGNTTGVSDAGTQIFMGLTALGAVGVLVACALFGC